MPDPQHRVLPLRSPETRKNNAKYNKKKKKQRLIHTIIHGCTRIQLRGLQKRRLEVQQLARKETK